MALTFYRDMVKEVKLKVREFPGLIFKFGHIIDEKRVGGFMFPTPTFFSPVPFPDVEISSQNVLSFGLKPFYKSAVNFNYDKYCHTNARVTRLWSNDHICNTI